MFNKTIIIGRLGYDPTLTTTKSGAQMCTFTVAVNTGWGENRSTDWYRVIVFGKQADACSKLSKGALVCVSGSLQLKEYEDRHKVKKAQLELSADSVTFLSAKSDNKSTGDNARTNNTHNQEVDCFVPESLESSEIPF